MSRRDPRKPWPGTETGLLALLGHPVGHSLSPVLHNAALDAAAIDMAYVAIDVEPAQLPDALAGLGPLGFVGVNVTVPHKQAVAAACVSLSPEAELVGAVNTVVVTDAGLHGHNTDTDGFLAGLPAGLPVGRAVVLGAGGAARAVVVALLRTGWTVTVLARREPAANELVEQVRTGWPSVASPAPAQRADTDPRSGPPENERGASMLQAAGLDEAEHAVAAADMVVNATPLGLGHERLPEPFMQLREDQVAHDLVYNPEVTPFLAAARATGAIDIGGLGMLVNQAAAAFELWTGVPADTELMTAAARRGLDTAP